MAIGKIDPIPVGPVGPRGPRVSRISGIRTLIDIPLSYEFTASEPLHAGGSATISLSRLRAFIRRVDSVDSAGGLESGTFPSVTTRVKAELKSGTTQTYKFDITLSIPDWDLPAWEDRAIRASVFVKRANGKDPEWSGGVTLDKLSPNFLLLTDEERNIFYGLYEDGAA